MLDPLFILYEKRLECRREGSITGILGWNILCNASVYLQGGRIYDTRDRVTPVLEYWYENAFPDL